MKNKKDYLSFLISHFSFRKGFTLIELMVVISITAVLGTLGIAGFTNYNQAQVLQTSSNEVVTMLNLAKSRAQSQVKIGTNCSNQNYPLNSYEVAIAANSYSLVTHCSSGLSNLSDTISSKILPASISFDLVKTSPASYLFPVSKGGVTTGGQIAIKDNRNNYKYITVNSLGGVSTQLSEPIPSPTPTPTPTAGPTPIPTSTPTPTPIPTQEPAPVQWPTLTLAFTNPNNSNIYTWGVSIYNPQTKSWEGQGNLLVQFLAALAPTDIDPPLPGVNFLLKITETTLTYGVGYKSYDYGPYLVTIPSVNGAYTWNSKNGTITPGQAINIAGNNSLMTGTVTSIDRYTYSTEYGPAWGWRGTVAIASANTIPPIPAVPPVCDAYGACRGGSPAVPSPLNIVKYFIGTTVTATITNVPYIPAYLAGGQLPGESKLQLNRSITGNLSYSDPDSSLNLLYYTTPYPPATFSGSITRVKINATQWGTRYSASGSISPFTVAIAGCSRWISCNQTLAEIYRFTGPATVIQAEDYLGGYYGPSTYLYMYFNPNPNPGTWNQWTWRMEGWQQ